MRQAARLLAARAQSLAFAGVAPQTVAPLSQHSAPLAPAAFSSAQVRWSQCACSGDISLPPPTKVVVEYSPADVDAFIAFADAVEEEFQGIIVDGVEVDGPPHSFDVKMEDGQLVFSRMAESSSSSSSLPEYSDLFARLRQAGLQAATA